MPSVSIVVPVYNAAKYLETCLQSLVEQTLRDLEIIVIDDGSTDDSWAIMQKFASQYSSVQIYQQENCGISITRNKGMELATGEYIAFIDSDDHIDEKMMEMLYEKAKASQLDLVVCDFYEVYEKGQHSQIYKIPSFEDTTLKKMPSLLFSINASPWNKLYRLQFLKDEHLQFPLNVKYEDTYVLLCAFLKASSIGKVDQPLLYYMIHEGSETTIMDARVFDIFTVLRMINDEYRKDKDYAIYHEQLEFFNINRITVYCLQQIYQKEPGLITAFIDQAYAFLQEQFPNWRNNVSYHKHNSLWKRLIKSHKMITKLTVTCKRRLI